MNAPLITIKHVYKTFDQQTPALIDINAALAKSQMIAMAGPDGAGKTTLIRLIAGLLRPSQGTIEVLEYNTLTQAEQIHALIGYMPQKFGLYEDLSVMQNLSLYADLRGVPKSDRKATFDYLLNFTALKPFTERLAGALSGGMKQKLGLACALIKKPSLLLLDEPSVGVDPISRRELWKMVYELLQEGISVIWSTAYLDEAERADTVLLLNEGKLLFLGAPGELSKRVEGRTFLISHIIGNRRKILEEALIQENIIDGVIQGSDVRIVVKDAHQAPLNLAKFKEYGDFTIIPTPPRFEDAFIDILGGGPKGHSALAEKITPQVPSHENIIEAKGLTKRFGQFTAADNITFTAPKGEIFGLLGPNGAGKSTTFKMLCGLLKPNSGSALVNGLDLQIAPSEGRAQIGYMAQKFSLYGNMSVRQNLEFFSGIYNLSNRLQEERIQQMIDVFDLKNYLNENAEALPLGYKQRLALSCAVMHYPLVLFLDEPTSGVDPVTRREFWNHINSLVEKGVTVMVTTHFMDEAENCDRIALVYRSKIIKIGTPDALKESAKSSQNPTPTLEDAFIELITRYDEAPHAS